MTPREWAARLRATAQQVGHRAFVIDTITGAWSKKALRRRTGRSATSITLPGAAEQEVIISGDRARLISRVPYMMYVMRINPTLSSADVSAEARRLIRGIFRRAGLL